MDEMNRVLAALHTGRHRRRGLCLTTAPTGNYYERQIARWTKQYRASETEELPDMDRLIDELVERSSRR